MVMSVFAYPVFVSSLLGSTRLGGAVLPCLSSFFFSFVCFIGAQLCGGAVVSVRGICCPFPPFTGTHIHIRLHLGTCSPSVHIFCPSPSFFPSDIALRLQGLLDFSLASTTTARLSRCRGSIPTKKGCIHSFACFACFALPCPSHPPTRPPPFPRIRYTPTHAPTHPSTHAPNKREADGSRLLFLFVFSLLSLLIVLILPWVGPRGDAIRKGKGCGGEAMAL